MSRFCWRIGIEQPVRILASTASIEPDPNGHRFLNKTSVPKDPWQNPYLYEPPVGSEKYRIYTLGRDGSPGGDGEDGDYSNHDLMAE